MDQNTRSNYLLPIINSSRDRMQVEQEGLNWEGDEGQGGRMSMERDY